MHYELRNKSNQDSFNSKESLDGQRFYEQGCKAFNKEDYRTAYENFRKAADKHIPAAMKVLGEMHMYNIYIFKREDEAVVWFKKAIALYKKHDQWDKIIECYKIAWPKLTTSMTEDLKIAQEKGFNIPQSVLEAVKNLH